MTKIRVGLTPHAHDTGESETRHNRSEGGWKQICQVKQVWRCCEVVEVPKSQDIARGYVNAWEEVTLI